MRNVVSSFFLLILICPIYSQNVSLFQSNDSQWAQKTLNNLTLEEKIGQLFIATTILEKKNYKETKTHNKTPIKQLIEHYHVGGLIYQGEKTSLKKQIEFTNHYQKITKIPLFIVQDLEWGLDMRLKNMIKFPYNMTLGAIQNNELIYQMAKEVGRQCKLIGIHINLAPVIDVNINPQNPVINYRSFGENKDLVACKSIKFMQGLQDEGIIACAKHFPGHGDTNVDSHLDLPLISHSLERLSNIELVPFQKIIEAGIFSIMIAHLEIPALEQTPGLPTTLSYQTVTNLLKKTLQFQGLIITDALNMQGILKHHSPGELELKALLAGNDLLIDSTDIPRSISYIKKAIQENLYSEKELDNHVLKILYTKEWVLNNSPKNCNEQDIETLIRKFYSPFVLNLKKTLYEKAITLVKNKNNIIPLVSHETIPCILIGIPKKQVLTTTLQQYIDIEVYELHANDINPEILNTLSTTIKTQKKIIIGLFGINKCAKQNYGISIPTLHLIDTLTQLGAEVILSVFGNAYALQLFDNPSVIIQAYEEDVDAQVATAKVILGQINPEGKLPITASEKYYAGLGLRF